MTECVCVRHVYLQSADEDGKAAVGLKGSHVQVGDEVHHPDCPRHKGDLVLLVPQELDHLHAHRTDDIRLCVSRHEDSNTASRCVG